MAQADQAQDGVHKYWSLLIYSAQFFFGGWFIFHGLNHWVHFFPQPPGASTVSSEVIRALIKSGLFDWVKAVEVVAGFALLFNRFVTVAAVAAFPISFVIGYLNVAVERDANSLFVLFFILGTNGLILLGHLDRLMPMLAPGKFTPNTTGLQNFLGGGERAERWNYQVNRRTPLKLGWHILALILGIALPVIITMTTLPKPGEPGAAQPAPAEKPAP